MIVDIFLNLGFGVLEWLLSWLPEFNVDCSGLTGLAGYMGWMDGWVNLAAFGTALATIAAAEVAIMTARSVVWLWEHLLPG